MILLVAAFAAPPEAYPLVSTVELPATGVLRVSLPPDAVGADPDSLPRALLVRDAAGQDVPYAVIDSRNRDDVASQLLTMRPVAWGLWEVAGAERPLERLELRFDHLRDPVVAEVTVGARTIREVLYQDLGGASDVSVDVGGVRGPFTVKLTPFSGPLPDFRSVYGDPREVDAVAPHVERIEVGAPLLTEWGSARWELPLAQPRRVTGLRVIAGGDVYERTVAVGVPDSEWASELTVAGTIRRIAVGDARVDHDRVTLDLVADTLLVDIPADRDTPLPVTAFEVESVAADLVVRDAGAGPHAVYAGSRDDDTAYDLGVALPELLAGEVTRLSAEFERNPGWTPIPSREGVDAPGPAVNLARYRWTRPILGGPGWVSIPLDAAVRAKAKVGLDDVRVVDAEGRGIPYVRRVSGRLAPWETGAFERTEEGTWSRFRVPLQGLDVPVAGVTLRTSATRFSREVELLRDRGRLTEAVRHVQWQSDTQGPTLSLQMNERFGEALLIRIQNHDNPPLPIDAVEVSISSHELRARIPEGGARLVYGAAAEPSPTYDLGLLYEEVWKLPVEKATLGPEVESGGTPLSTVDRGVVLGAILLLALGLVGVTWRALAPAPEPAEPPPATG